VLTYQARTEEILQRYLDGRIGRSQCSRELFVAFTALLPKLTAENIHFARELARANHAAMMHEARRREGRHLLLV